MANQELTGVATKAMDHAHCAPCCLTFPDSFTRMVGRVKLVQKAAVLIRILKKFLYKVTQTAFFLFRERRRLNFDCNCILIASN